MLRWARIAAAQAALALLCSIAPMTLSRPAQAQLFNSVCATQFGMCQANPAPVGTTCGCRSPAGPVYGQILPPSGGYAPQQQQQAISNACRTFRGICETYPAPVGSSCNCFGDLGAVIPR